MPSTFTSEEIQERTSQVETTLRCPYCDGSLAKWQVPDTPFVEWSSEFQYICFNDECPYFVRGWKHIEENYATHASYRYRVDPTTGKASPLAVWSHSAIKDRIIDASVSVEAGDDGTTAAGERP